MTGKVQPTGLDGSLHFFDGATDLGVADTYTASTGVGGKTATLTAGSHTLTATFVPNDPAFAKSTSANVDYSVVPVNLGSSQIQLSANDASAPYTGNLALSVGSGTSAALAQVDPESAAGHPALASDATGHRHAWVFTGSLSGISVQDTRPSEAGWKLTGQATSFANGTVSVPAANLGWDPKLVTTGSDAEGTVVLASADKGNGLGTANFSSALELRIPDTSPAGNYSSTLTLTLINP
jgi:hypothetical protein